MVSYKNILFATDFSEDANIAFIHALDLAKKHGAKLHILHVPHSSYTYLRQVVDEHVPEGAEGGETFFNEEVAKRAEEALMKEYGKRLEGFQNYVMVVKEGAPDVEIIRYAKKNNIDVIVMGALGKSEQERIEHGSTVANVSKYAHCHVIAIRNPAKRFILPGEIL
ncbi:MAG: universal stress protein [Deltaproteobacteria bacterium]|nr:universal stress protein [Deltaproteobacteria bacterium]MBW2016300.1 universal stress protein [Deltaproteobacteria bacterium]MBW2129250.1 universal stress protein [Deltaproteobacteria bacterium]MBW2304357.1 universal stress protein [Deltaproteobacteria bacterium]